VSSLGSSGASGESSVRLVRCQHCQRLNRLQQAVPKRQRCGACRNVFPDPVDGEPRRLAVSDVEGPERSAPSQGQLAQAKSVDWSGRLVSVKSWLDSMPPFAKRMGGTLLVGIVGMALVAALGGAESKSAPRVGECARIVGVNDIERVPCSDPAASLRVTSRQDGTSDGSSACANDPRATSSYSYEASSRGSSLVSFVLCFEDV